MSSRPIAIIVTGFVVLGLILYWASKKDKPEPSDAEQYSEPSRELSPLERTIQQAEQRASQRASERHQATPKPASLTKIVIDGQADEWSQVPTALVVQKDDWDDKNYTCKAVKLARDETNIYILFELSLGIGERYEKQLATPPHEPSSGALGYLKLHAGGEKFTIWIPTGVSITFDLVSRKVKEQSPTASFEVGRYNSQADSYDKIFEAESIDNPEFVAFEGKFLELKIPTEKLGIRADEPIRVELDEM